LKNEEDVGCILKLSSSSKGLPLLIFGAAGTNAATYKPLVDHFSNMEVYCIEYPGRGTRADEPLETDFEKLFAGILPDVKQWESGRDRFFFWGDSLGTVLAYEAAKNLSRRAKGLLGLIVSGNAGPTVAALEQGMGANTSKAVGREISSVSDMTFNDWKQFFVASMGEEKKKSMEALLADDALAEEALKSLIADCTAYESYTKCDGTRIRSPIYTLRGAQDLITSPTVMKSWEKVAGSRVEHFTVAKSGHMLIQEVPKRLAEIFSNISLPDFSAELKNYGAVRAAYRNRWMAPKLKKAASNHFSSPSFGPQTKEPQVPDFDLLNSAERVTPNTKGVQEMRAMNMAWRRDSSKNLGDVDSNSPVLPQPFTSDVDGFVRSLSP
jgi:surfactin synthase thioesterase subunit